MYSRRFSNLLVAIGSKLKQKNVSGIKIITGGLLSSSIVETSFKTIPTVSLISNRNYCSSTRPPNKDEECEVLLKEFVKDPENKRLFDILQLEVEVMRQNGENVPAKIRPRDWYELTLLESRNKRRRFLDFLFGIEKRKEHMKEKRAVKREERDKFFSENDPAVPEYLQYKLGANSPFLRVYDSTMNNYYNWQLLKASMFNTKIILDCGFEKDMTRSELKNCAKQLQLTFAANRAHKDPFDLHYYNLNTNGILHRDFYSYIPTMYDEKFPINLTSKHYLQDFSKDQLVYLTPDASIEMKKFDHDVVYIIGAIVDKVSGKPLTLAKAKKEGIRMAKLPMDTYLHFGSGSGKSLTLNQMIDILLDVKMTNDWEFALRHVPRRKLFESRQKAMIRKAQKFLNESSDQAEAYSPPRDFSFESRKKFQIKK